MWKFYPKQVQNILKKKRIDRERLRRSLKPPGKRNYKVLFSNVKRVSFEEVSKASEMFKGMKDTYYRLLHAENKIYKALREKGLFLDQKDFNIMEVLNSGLSNYSSEYDHQSEVSSEKKNEEIYVEEFESTSAKQKINENSEKQVSNPDIEKENERCNLEIRSFDRSETPNSRSFEPISNHSKNTFKSQNTFISRHSHRMLLNEYPTERRIPVSHHFQPGKDFL